jgi:hypothetical protein
VLYHLNRLQEAREQFEASCSVDEDDVEPWLWRFLVRWDRLCFGGEGGLK